MVYRKASTSVEKTEIAGGRVAFPPGLEDLVNEREPYKHVFFGAQRDWPNDEIGWTRVPATKMVYKNIEGETLRFAVRVNRRDINRYERKQAGWNLA